MSEPSSQVLACWAKDDLYGSEWISLRDMVLRSVKNRLRDKTETTIYDIVEKNYVHIIDHLREEVFECSIDGKPSLFEIDGEEDPYIRLLDNGYKPILSKLRKIPPASFEYVCALILRALGAESEATKKTCDGGIDFQGVKLNIVTQELSTPLTSKVVIIGQAKRYKDGNMVKETQVREFVGAAILRRHELQRDRHIGPLSPVVLAFWTTSDFDANAKRYARSVGLWYMDGHTLANYVMHLGLTNDVAGLEFG